MKMISKYYIYSVVLHIVIICMYLLTFLFHTYSVVEDDDEIIDSDIEMDER